jgi:lipopolysaccharide/colanic/teichoic acid biosynthesis glycosyltransferase
MLVKRSFDITGAALGLFATFPLLALISLWIKLYSPGPIFYRGVRVGLHGKMFRTYKFRTMVVDAEKIGGPSTADGDPRITRVGRYLRKYKLDELPELINVLWGDMSFVGPRPEVPQEVELYSEEERALLTVLPGITDYASIKFNNEGEILAGSDDPHQAYREMIRPRKIELGLEYVRNHSFWVDLKLLGMTLVVLMQSRLKRSQ